MRILRKMYWLLFGCIHVQPGTILSFHHGLHAVGNAVIGARGRHFDFFFERISGYNDTAYHKQRFLYQIETLEMHIDKGTKYLRRRIIAVL